MLNFLRDLNLAHLVVNLAAWRLKATNLREYCLLYPKATCDLRGLLEATAVPLDKDGVLWFLKQLLGLARTIKRIHEAGTTDVKSSKTNKTPKGLEDVFGHSDKECSHQDIKPANILVFEKHLGRHPVLKLSDLGSGYVHAKNPQSTFSTGSVVSLHTFAYGAR